MGDFGLVHNLAECDASMLEGMTPRYAAPEVFEGRPSRFSDQFSLAVVYAELLTASRRSMPRVRPSAPHSIVGRTTEARTAGPGRPGRRQPGLVPPTGRPLSELPRLDRQPARRHCRSRRRRPRAAADKPIDLPPPRRSLPRDSLPRRSPPHRRLRSAPQRRMSRGELPGRSCRRPSKTRRW